MRRRTTLASLFAACCLPNLARAQETGWSYDGADSPSHWGQLNGAFRACGDGSQQSPIDLQDPIAARLPPAKVHWRPTPLSVVNPGFNMALNPEPGSFMVLDGRRFDLLAVHFHQPGEHKLAGQGFPMSVHAVHRHANGDLAVLGLLVVEGAANPVLQPLWATLPLSRGQRARSDTIVRLPDLLPRRRDQYRYAGSLTTPPCTENVNWVLMVDPIELSKEQLSAYVSAFPPHARPVQPLNRRYVLSPS